MARLVRTTSFGLAGLGSAASDAYEESRSEDPLLLARDASGIPARQYTMRDAAEGLVPASEALDTPVTRDSYETPTSYIPDAVDEVVSQVTYALGVPRTPLKVSNLVGAGLGLVAFFTGARVVGGVLVASSVLDFGLRAAVPGWARFRARQP